MSDKEIIIDDVDVSGCDFYRDDNGVFAPDGTAERTELCYLTNDYCGNSPNCNYKQLKRKEQECDQLRGGQRDQNKVIKELKAKEQECEMWKHQAELGSDTTDRLAKQLEEKEQELDDCREELNWLHNQLDQLKVENGDYLYQLNALKPENVLLHQIINKQLQTLQEIKEIAERINNEGIYGYVITDELEKILQKCEVVDE